MSKAGLFAGEVTQAAPADGAITTKGKGYQWMEWAIVPVAPVQSRCLGWWEFEEPSTPNPAPSVLDEVASYEFDPQNAYTSVTGVRGQAGRIAASGSENFVSIALPDSFTINDQIWGMTAWYKTPASLASQNDLYILSSWKHQDLADAPPRRRFRVKYNALANGFIYSIGNGPLYTDIIEIDTGNIGISTEQWYHFACTHDPDADEMTFTVSERGDTVAGTRLAETIVGGAYQGTTPVITNVDLFLGRDLTGIQKADGVLDMVAFWGDTEILSEDEVSALFLDEIKYSELPTS